MKTALKRGQNMDSARPESSLNTSKQRPTEKRDRSPEFWSRSTHTTHTTPAGIFITFRGPRGPFSTHTTPTTVENLDSERDSAKAADISETEVGRR